MFLKMTNIAIESRRACTTHQSNAPTESTLMNTQQEELQVCWNCR